MPTDYKARLDELGTNIGFNSYHPETIERVASELLSIARELLAEQDRLREGIGNLRERLYMDPPLQHRGWKGKTIMHAINLDDLLSLLE